jgi:sugar lactone lactonase YvrE
VDATTGIITTVAGTGEFAFSGDGGLATESALSFPNAVVLDGSGNLLLVGSDSRIRQVDATTGIMTTVAGTSEAGFQGDGGPATEAVLNQPFGLVMDGIGNLFVSDTLNNRIRKVDVITGTIVTVAGTGERGFTGNGGLAIEAAVRNPTGLLVDGDGNLLIGDSGNHRIRKVDTTTGIITTIAGTGEAILSGDGGPAIEASLNGPNGVALDRDGNLFIADRNDNRIRKVEMTTGIITTVAGSGLFGPGTGSFSGDGGPATEATLDSPVAVAVDSDGHLFIADSSNHRVRRVDAQTGIIMTVAGTGEQDFSGDGGLAIEAGLHPFRLTLDGDGNLLIGDTINHRILKVDTITGIITTVAGTGQAGFSGDGGPATEAALDTPHGVAVDIEGDLFIAAGFNHRVRKVDAITGIITTVVGDGEFSFTGDGGPALEASLATPTDVAMDDAGNLFIADNNNRRIRAVRGVARAVVPPGIGPRPPVTNLTPFRPSGWTDPIVVSNTTGTHTDSQPLVSTDTLFVDYAALNDGPVSTFVRFDNTVLVDGEEVFSSFSSPPLEPGFFTFFEDFELGPLSAGTHTVTLVVDSTSQIAESNESDNTFTKTIVIADDPQEVTISVTNHLIYSVSIVGNGSVLGSVSAGQTMTSSLGSLSSLELSWELDRPTVEGRPIGEEMGGDFNTINNPSGTIPFTIDNVIGDVTYFAPFISNNSSDGLLMGVDMGLQSENRCDCVVGASAQGIGLGYYRLFSNSNVRGYQTGSDYTGPYLFWGHDAVVNPEGNLTPLVESESGATRLQATSAP